MRQAIARLARDQGWAVTIIRVDRLTIDGAWVFTPQVHRDDRGNFFEAFRGAEFAANLGYQLEVAQVNCSASRRGVIRGIHYSDVPPGQAKFVTCMAGAIMDVVVDLREGSPGFGAWEATRLDDTSGRAVFLSEGLGHAFMALTEQATVLYLCSTPYAPGREHAVNPLDPAIGITWPLDDLGGAPVLSAKDAAAPSLKQALRDGALPRYDDCASYSAWLRAETLPSPSLRAGSAHEDLGDRRGRVHRLTLRADPGVGWLPGVGEPGRDRT